MSQSQFIILFTQIQAYFSFITPLYTVYNRIRTISPNIPIAIHLISLSFFILISLFFVHPILFDQIQNTIFNFKKQSIFTQKSLFPMNLHFHIFPNNIILVHIFINNIDTKRYFVIQTLMEVSHVSKVYADVNLRRPMAYWNYNRYEIPWGYVFLPFHLFFIPQFHFIWFFSV